MLTQATLRRIELKAERFALIRDQFISRWLYRKPDPKGFAFAAPVACNEIAHAMADFYCHPDLPRTNARVWFVEAEETLEDLQYIIMRCCLYNLCSNKMLPMHLSEILFSTFEHRLRLMKGGKEIHRRYWS